MQGMFAECEIPAGFFLGDKFSTSNVTNMRGMFNGCKMPVGFSLGDKFDTSNVTDMSSMFYECELPEGFILGNKFDTSSVTNMNNMFYKCKMPEDFTLGSGFTILNAVDPYDMFTECKLPEGKSLKDFNKSSYHIICWLKQRKNYLQGKEKVHYEGALGNFDYDPREFIITPDECLCYYGNGNSVSLPKGCVNTQYMFKGCVLPDGFKLVDFDTYESYVYGF